MNNTSEINFKDSGIYTFYNSASGLFLADNGTVLKTGTSERKWTLRRIRDNVFRIMPVGSDMMLDIDNMRITRDNRVKLHIFTGYPAQEWSFLKNANGTYSIVYNCDNSYCLGFCGGNAQLQLRNTADKSQEWLVCDLSHTLPKQHIEFTSRRGIIELKLPTDIYSVISPECLQKWADDLEKAYYTFAELTSYVPYKKLYLEAYRKSDFDEYFGWVIRGSDIIHINRAYIHEELRKMSVRQNDWNFAALHEMGHLFEMDCPWGFEGEMLSDVMLAYVLQKNDAAAALAEYNEYEVFKGAEIYKAYCRNAADFSEKYDVFGCIKRVMEIQHDIGWEPFRQAFHHMQRHREHYLTYPKQDRFVFFIKLLTRYSGKDIKSRFSADEWNSVIKECSK